MMTSKECEEQLKRLIYDWETEGLLTKINATDIEAIKHLMIENKIQHKEISRLKQPTIFIDTQDMEERYAEGLYMDYLKEENKKLKDRDLIIAAELTKLQDENIRLKKESQKQKEVIDKAIEFTNKKWSTWCTHHLEYMTELQNILNEGKK